MICARCGPAGSWSTTKHSLTCHNTERVDIFRVGQRDGRVFEVRDGLIVRARRCPPGGIAVEGGFVETREHLDARNLWWHGDKDRVRAIPHLSCLRQRAQRHGRVTPRPFDEHRRALDEAQLDGRLQPRTTGLLRHLRHQQWLITHRPVVIGMPHPQGITLGGEERRVSEPLIG